MATAPKFAPMLTRKLKQSVLDNPDKVELLDQETQEQLKLILQSKTPSTHSSAARVPSQSSHNSVKSGSSVHLRQRLESTVWIQCDNLDCLKWRKVTTAEIEGVTEDSKWFCSMNNDQNFASCHVPEEDTEWYDKAAKRVGLCYVKTPIAEGSLVWAKMVGYCKWPGIVTKDPSNQLHHMLNVDGEPLWYHVEFLGGSHTHSWVRAASVKLFTQKSSPLAKSSCGRKQGFPRNRPKKCLTVNSKNKPLEKTMYKNGVSVVEACLEASKLYNISNTERLCMCNFVNTFSGRVVEVSAGKTVQAPEDGGAWETKCKNISVKQRLKTTEDENKENCDPNKKHLIPHKPLEFSPNICESSNLPNLEMKFSDSLLNHSKEEKLVLDVQMYQRNERAFEHDVLRFMKRNDMTFRGVPRWQNTYISLFQLFLTVHERGGYEKVCSVRGGWGQVYKELTECSNVGNAAKKYFKRNLYPYELYIKGKDYKNALPAKHRCCRKKKKESKKDSHASSHSITVPCTDTVDVQIDSSQDLTEHQLTNLNSYLDQDSLSSSEPSVDLMEMLGELETSGNLCSLEDDVMMSKARLGIDITFFDQTPPRPMKDCRNIKEANTASEFGYANIPDAENNAQEVPEISIHSESDPDQLLHEMQALQDGIDMVAGEMNYL